MDPYLVVGQLLKIVVIEHLVGRADPFVHRFIVEVDQAGIGGIVHILGAIGDDLSLLMIESRPDGRQCR